MGKSKAAVSGTAVCLGLVMDGLGVAELLGFADIGIFPDIRVNWPVVMILAGTAILSWSSIWIGYGLLHDRSEKFRKLYPRIVELRTLITEIQTGIGFHETLTRQECILLANLLAEQFKIRSPSKFEEWPVFLTMLAPWAYLGDLRRARKLCDGQKFSIQSQV